jgi:hypothetical protein
VLLRNRGYLESIIERQSGVDPRSAAAGREEAGL